MKAFKLFLFVYWSAGSSAGARDTATNKRIRGDDRSLLRVPADSRCKPYSYRPQCRQTPERIPSKKPTKKTISKPVSKPFLQTANPTKLLTARPTQLLTARPTQPLTARPTQPLTARPTQPLTARPTQPLTARPTSKPTMPPIAVPKPIIQLYNLSETAFNPLQGPLCFNLSSSVFDTNTANVSLAINSQNVPAIKITIIGNLLCGDVLLSVGSNNVSLLAADAATKESISFDTVIWAGSATIVTNILDGASNSPYALEVSVTAMLADNKLVTSAKTTKTGSVLFTNLPPRTIIFVAQGAANELGSIAAVAGQSASVQITLTGFNVPSDIDNNDFQQSLAGWVTKNPSAATIIPHVEIVGPASPSRRLLTTTGSSNQDLLLSTNGVVNGQTSISRTFKPKTGTKVVQVRYRFITREVPGGYFGSRYNDYFRVSIRSKNAGNGVTQASSMNSLGLAAFDYASGSTAWRYATLPVDSDGDIVQVDLTVANVADGLYDSSVVVDFVEEMAESLYLCIYTNVAQPVLETGHAVLMLYNASAKSSITYGNWPDANEKIINASLANGAGSDIRVNFAYDAWSCADYPYVYCEPIGEKQIQTLQTEVNRNWQWTCTNNCASFASEVFYTVTGTDVDNDENFFLGFDSPREIGKSIKGLNGGSNIPTAGLPWQTNCGRRGLTGEVVVTAGVIVTSFLASCHYFDN